MSRLIALSLALLLVACTAGRPGANTSEASGPGSSSVGPTASVPPSLPLRIVSSSYGAVQVQTDPGARCTLAITVNAGRYGDGPPSTFTATADPTGAVAWTYPAPLAPAGRSRHSVECTGTN